MSQFSQAPHFQWRFLHPRYLHTWMGIGLMYLLSWLPYKFQRFLGFKLGSLIMRILKSRKKIAQRNLELCFPNMDEQERENLLKENFKHMGLAFFETCIAWFWPDWRLKKIVEFEGFEDIPELKNQGKGILIVAIHSYHLELSARAFSLIQYGYGVYRPNTNPVYDWFQYRGRTRLNKLIDRTDVKQMLRKLKQGELLWYAPDHDYGKHRSVWAPLFAVDKACTTTGTHLLAAASKCHVMSLSMVGSAKGYRLSLTPVLTDFPYTDKEQAAIYTNKLIEKAILRAPEQYMWLHRRFKTRPEGEASLYD